MFLICFFVQETTSDDVSLSNEMPISEHDALSNGREICSPYQHESFPDILVPEPSVQSLPDKPNLKEMAIIAMERMISLNQEKDEFTIFGEWIASELRNLSPDHARLAKRKIGRATSEALDELFLMVGFFALTFFYPERQLYISKFSFFRIRR